MNARPRIHSLRPFPPPPDRLMRPPPSVEVVRGKNPTPMRTVAAPSTPEEPLLRALWDVRSPANKLLRTVGRRTVIFEDLSAITEDVLNPREGQRKNAGPGNEARRRLPVCTHRELQRIGGCKSNTAVLRVNLRGDLERVSPMRRCGAPPVVST